MTQKIDKRDIFVKGKQVALKVLTRDDVIKSDWYGWLNDEHLCNTLQKHYFPSTMESQLLYWEKYIHNAKDKLQLGICALDKNEILGVTSLNQIDFINQKAEFSIIIGSSKNHNLNYFIEACKLLFNHGFYSLNLNRIYGGSMSRDLVLLMCRTLSCQEEGVSHQDVYKNGKYCDVYRYAVLREDFTKLLTTKDE